MYTVDKQKQQFNCRKTHTTVTQMIQLLYTLGEPVSKYLMIKTLIVVHLDLHSWSISQASVHQLITSYKGFKKRFYLNSTFTNNCGTETIRSSLQK